MCSILMTAACGVFLSASIGVEMSTKLRPGLTLASAANKQQ